MKAAMIRDHSGKFSVEDVDLAAPIEREVLVDVRACGLCHSDLHLAEDDYGYPVPAVLGHEPAGVVAEIGPGVTDFVVGDHVVGSLVQFCGHCESCLDGRTYQCLHPDQTLRRTGQSSRITQHGEPINQTFGLGGFAERVLVHENQLVKVPDAIPFPQAAILGCGTITGAGAAINTADVQPGDSVAVIGVGGVGLNVISGARLAGASCIVAVDLQPAKLELARKFGATECVDAGQGDPVDAVRKLTGGGVDHAFEVIGLKSTSEQALQMVKVGGGAYLIGLQVPGQKIEVEVMMDMIFGQRKVQGVMMGSTNIKHDIPMYAELYLQGRLDLDDLIAQEINIEQINDAYQELKYGAIARSVITSF
jgi:S-(hydroxymethyl)glutathione dehydrogenase/alcohol dehydrogenase